MILLQTDSSVIHFQLLRMVSQAVSIPPSSWGEKGKRLSGCGPMNRQPIRCRTSAKRERAGPYQAGQEVVGSGPPASCQDQGWGPATPRARPWPEPFLCFQYDGSSL